MNNPDIENILLIVMTSAAVILAAAVAVLLTVLRKRRTGVPQYDPDDETEILSQTMTDSSGTVLLSGGKTAVLFSENMKFIITLTAENDPLEKYEMTSEENVIGRNSQLADVVISSDSNISQRHCKIYTRESNVYISDLGSLNNTFVNGEPAGDEYPLRSGDVIGIGKKKFEIKIREY